MSTDSTISITIQPATRAAAAEALSALAENAKQDLSRVLEGYKATLTSDDSDDSTWSSTLLIVDEQKNGAEVEFTWTKSDAAKAAIEVSTHQAVADRARMGAMLLCILGVMLVADQNPQILPVFRGMRVAIGALGGLILAFPVGAAIGSFVGRKSASKVEDVANIARKKLQEIADRHER